MYYAYILQSVKDKRTYAGFCEDINIRLKMHNSGRVKATKNRRPFTILLTEEGEIYGFGSNKYGQLGLDNECKDVICPTKINISCVLSICCGDNHTIVYSKNGLYLLHKNNSDCIHKIDLNKCVGCHLCLQKCPKKAIKTI